MWYIEMETDWRQNVEVKPFVSCCDLLVSWKWVRSYYYTQTLMVMKIFICLSGRMPPFAQLFCNWQFERINYNLSFEKTMRIKITTFISNHTRCGCALSIMDHKLRTSLANSRCADYTLHFKSIVIVWFLVCRFHLHKWK